MDDRIWRNISIALGVICALLIGVAGALMIVGGRSGAPGELSAPTFVAAASTPAGSPNSSGAGSSAVASGSVGAATPAGSLVSKPATIVFNGVGLDAQNDTAGTLRTFTFQTDGNGALNIAVTKTSAGGSTRLCLKVDAGTPVCTIGSLPKFTKAYADTAHSTWTVTLQGYGSSKPTDDLTLTWPTATPKVTVSHGRLQGTGASEAYNGFTAQFQPRNSGQVNVQASWTLVTVDAGITLTDVTSTPTVKLDERTYTGATYVNPPYTFNVDGTKVYQVKLRNGSADAQRPDLTAQISFP